MRRRLVAACTATVVAVAACQSAEPDPPNAVSFEVWDEAIGWVNLAPAPEDEPDEVWRHTVTDDELVIVAGATVLVASRAGTTTTVQGLDALTGEPSWSTDVSTGDGELGVDIDPQRDLVGVRHDASADRSTLTLLDADDGGEVWAGDVADSASWLTVDDLVVVTDFVDPSSISTAIDRATGEVRWSVERALEVRDGVLLVDDILAETIGVVDPSTGELAWERPRQAFSDAHVVGSTLTLTVDLSGEVDVGFGYDVAAGEQRWRLDLPSLERAETVALDDETVLLTHGGDVVETAEMVAVDLSTGASVWQQRYRADIDPPQAFLVDGEPRVLFESVDGELAWLDGRTGEVLDTADRPAAAGALASFGNGIVYVDREDGVRGIVVPQLDERWDVPIAADGTFALAPIDGGFLVQTLDELIAYRG